MSDYNDMRAKQIMNEYQRLSPDDTFRFHCTQCGKCCLNREDILLNPKDLFRIAQHLGLTVGEAFEKYCETYIGENSRVPIVRLKPRGSIKRCPLLKEHKCMVHEAKPTVCALFPLGRMLELPKLEAEEPKLSDAKLLYIFSDPHCGDASEEHTVRQWLEAFSLPLEDDFFLQWHQTTLTVGSAVKMLEAKCPPAVMNMLWTAAFTTLYLNYRTEEDFHTQFSENSAAICGLVRELLSIREDDSHV